MGRDVQRRPANARWLHGPCAVAAADCSSTPMSAALAWLDQTLDTHGEELADGRVRVRRSQAALAEEAGCSAGTISYYLRVLGHAVSVTRGDGLVVDPRALGRIDGFDELARRRRRRGEDVAEVLAKRWGRAADTAGCIELVDGDGRAPTVRLMADALGLNPSTTQRHLDALNRDGRLFRRGRRLYLCPPGQRPAGSVGDDAVAPAVPGAGAAHSKHGPDPELLALLANAAGALVRVAGDLAALGRDLLEFTADSVAAGAPPANGDPRLARAQIAGIRDCAPLFADAVPSEGPRKTDRGFLPSFLPRTAEHLRDDVRGSRGEDAPEAASLPRISPASTAEEVTTALAPLQRACERLALPSVVDQRGRRWLSRYSSVELERGVTQVLRQLEGGAALATPMGLLVSKAKAGEDDFFAPAPLAPGATPWSEPATAEPEPVDAEAVAAISGMGPEQLAQLDEAVRARLQSVLGTSRRRSIDGVLNSEDGLSHWRAAVWREQRSPTEGAM